MTKNSNQGGPALLTHLGTFRSFSDWVDVQHFQKLWINLRWSTCKCNVVCATVVLMHFSTGDCNIVQCCNGVTQCNILTNINCFSPTLKSYQGRQDLPPWFEFLVIFYFFAPLYSKRRGTSCMKFAKKNSRKDGQMSHQSCSPILGFYKKLYTKLAVVWTRKLPTEQDSPHCNLPLAWVGREENTRRTSTAIRAVRPLWRLTDRLVLIVCTRTRWASSISTFSLEESTTRRTKVSEHNVA